MKKIALLSLVAACLSGGFASTASAQVLKVGTVDMKSVFERYYKTKDAEMKINEERNDAKKQLDDRMETYQRAGNDYQKLQDELNRPELSQATKESKMKLRDEKLADLNAQKREIQEFQSSKEKFLQERSVRMRSGIVDEINKVVSDRVQSEQFDLVLDRSGPSLNGVPVVLFAKKSWDFTDDVVTTLNKTKGTEKVEVEPPVAVRAATPAARKPK